MTKTSKYEAIENLNELNLHELREEAERFEIFNTNDMTKSELIGAIISESANCNLIKKVIKGFFVFDSYDMFDNYGTFNLNFKRQV